MKIFLFPSLQNKSYYLPGDAVVYGTMNNAKVWEDGKFIRVFGHGTLSGDKLPHPSHADPPIPSEDNWTYHPIDIQGQKFNFLPSLLQLSKFENRCCFNFSRRHNNSKLCISLIDACQWL